MSNIQKITAHIASKLEADGQSRDKVMHFYHRENGKNYLVDDQGFWRISEYVPDSVTYNECDNLDRLRSAGKAFGNFQMMLSDFDATELYETIPNFHNTVDRYRIFHETLERAKNDPELAPRVEAAKDEIAFVLEREHSAGVLQEMRDSGDLPTRVTHNDTKLNNVLLDKDTRQLLYVIDLDTVMPGLSLYDYGDCIRFGAATASEDEKDLSKVHCDLHLFEVFTKGFIESCKGLTDLEIEMLPVGARTITLELGVRFLTDWLDGDKYFATKYPGHNLDRCRSQLALVLDMESKREEMKEIVNELSGH
jgi:Ser/Thr protein kinase RdoA (MazF antagonist)